MKKIVQAAGIAAALALTAGTALAQAGASAGSAGTTGVVTGTQGASTTATGIAPADGSNALQQAGGLATQGMPSYHSPWGGGTVVQSHQTRVVDGNNTVITTYYWAGVPADVHSDASFQRWQRLR